MPISHLSQYCLDGALEHHEITPDIYLACTFGDIDVDEIHDRLEDRNPQFRPSWSAALGEAATAWWNTATPGQQAIVITRSLAGFVTMITEAAQYLGEIIVTSYEVETAATSFMVDAEVSARYRHLPSVEDALDQGAIDLVIDRHLGLWIGHLATMTARCASIQDVTERQIAEAVNEAQIREARRIEAVCNAMIAAREADGERPCTLPVPQQPTRRERKRIRRVMNRSIAIGERVVGPGTVRAVLKGDEASVEGTRYIYKMKRRASLVQQTAAPNVYQHPFTVTIHRKEDGARLADGCVYFEDTPAIDQLVALALHVRDREAELDLLRATNMFMRTGAFQEDQFLTELKPISLNVLNDPLAVDDFMPTADMERRRAMARSFIPRIVERLAERSGDGATFRRMMACRGEYSPRMELAVECIRTLRLPAVDYDALLAPDVAV